MTQDKNKGINLITYNHLNQPEVVDFGTKRTEYLYTATGGMLKTEIYEDGDLKSTTDYCGAYVYENNTLSYIKIPGGRIVNNQSSVNSGKALTESNYQYNLTDQLGNVRVTFTKDTATGNAIIIQEDHYYPFGMRMSGQHFTNTDLINKFLYNGKELQEQTGYYDYGFRQLDPALGRWHVPDAMAEKYMSSSPYAYVGNNPINHTDLLGLTKQWQNPDDFNATDRWLSGSGISSYIYNLNNNINSGFSQSSSFYSLENAFSASHTNIEGTWINNGDIISIDNVEAIEFVMNNLKNRMTLTFIEVSGGVIPIASVGDLGFILFEDGAITDVGGEKAAVYLGDAEAIGTVASFNRWIKNVGTTFNMLTDWATGTGSNYRNFYNDEVSAAMRNAKGVNQMRNKFYKNNKGKTTLTGIPFKNPGFGLLGIYNAGIDPIEQFIGSYNVKIDVVDDNLQYTIYNTTTAWSFLYHIIPQSWNPACGPARTTQQFYIFTEPIKYDKL